MTNLSISPVEEARCIQVALALIAAEAILVDQTGLTYDLLGLEHLRKHSKR